MHLDWAEEDFYVAWEKTVSDSAMQFSRLALAAELFFRKIGLRAIVLLLHWDGFEYNESLLTGAI